MSRAQLLRKYERIVEKIEILNEQAFELEKELMVTSND